MASLYRKWRPTKFDDVMGQSHVVDTILHSLKKDLSGHAYLFTGPRGTGKTTVARLLGKSLNCLSPGDSGGACNKCSVCKVIDDGTFLDIIEVDAASNRGIDEIRDLRDKVRFKPTLGKKKIFIIDEVHMLTKEAFNALLKTLEEPPGHVVFILATTEPHKIPQTIISRTQRFDFRPATIKILTNHLEKIAKNEEIDITSDALEFIATIADGSFRDSLSLLEQIQNIGQDQKIDQKKLELLLGLPSQKLIKNIFEGWYESNDKIIFESLQKASEQGVNMEQVTRELMKLLYRVINSKHNNVEETDYYSIVAAKTDIRQVLVLLSKIIEETANIKLSPIPQIPLQIALITTMPKKVINEELESENINYKTKEEINEVVKEVISETVAESQVEVYEIADDMEFRQALLEAAKPLNHSIFATLKVANILRNGKSCIIEVHYPFHLEQLSKKSAKALLNDLVRKFACSDLEIKLNRETKKNEKKAEKSDDLIEFAKEIFD